EVIMNEKLNQTNNCLSKCTQLEELTLDYTERYAEDDHMSLLFNDLPLFVNLQSLTLKFLYCQISEEGASVLAEFIQNFNQIKSAGMSKIIEAVNNIKRIEHLQIWTGENNIGDDGALAIGLGLNHWKNITNLQLYLHENKISKNGIFSIAKGLSSLTQIKILGISLLQIDTKIILFIFQNTVIFFNLRK
ncbi:hypothetical protein ABPG74_020032, partial [Tetrahymena malaccensis]